MSDNLSERERELFHRSIAHGASALPTQPWEQEASLPIFDPQKALFPPRLRVPVQAAPLNEMIQNATAASATVVKRKLQPVDCAWQRAVKASVPKSSDDKKIEALNKVVALLTDFATFFDLATLASQDKPGDVSSVEAVLAPKSPATVLKHVGPLRRFCQWCVKSHIKPEIQEKHFWTYMQCVAKLQQTAPSTLDTSMKALKWSYHAMGFNLDVKLLQSSRITGMANKLLQGKNPWRPAAPLTVQEVKQLHRFAEDETVSVPDRVAAIHFLGMLYARARASDTKIIHEILVDKPHATWEHAFIEMSTLHHKTARLDSQKRRLLPLVMPASGIAEVDVGETWCKVRDLAGLPIDLKDGPFFPAPEGEDKWSNRALESGEISRWLQALLPRPEHQQALTSHSLKVTTLTWRCKFGLSRETRRALGHHADAASGSDAVYGRDAQALALREYQIVLDAVRTGKFCPDAARSGEALALASASEESDQDLSQGIDYWAHHASTIVHKATLGAAVFMCGRPFEDTYKRVPMVKLTSHPLCNKCFPDA